MGGSAADIGTAIAVDPATSAAYLTGYTYSTNFPVTANAFQKKLACTNSLYINANAFVAKIAAGGTNLNYSSYFGGTNFDEGTGITFNNGNVIVAGFTLSTNFPWTNGLAGNRYLNGYPTNATGVADAFVTAFTTAGTNLTLLYSTYLGSTNGDYANGVVADAAGNAYIVGSTTSTNFPNTTNGINVASFVHTNTLGLVVATNAFLTQLKWNGSNAYLGYSRTFGGQGADIASGVALDAAGNIFVVGSTSSTNFPTTSGNLFGSLRATNSGGSDVFVTAFASDFSAVLYSAYLGGFANDSGNAIAVDAAGNAYVTGQTFSTNFPAFNARQSSLNSTNDAFLAKITMAAAPLLSARSAGTNVLVFWPPVGQAVPPFLGLETSTNLINTNWIVVTNQSPVLTNGNYTYSFNPTNPARFFRFHKF